MLFFNLTVLFFWHYLVNLDLNVRPMLDLNFTKKS